MKLRKIITTIAVIFFAGSAFAHDPEAESTSKSSQGRRSGASTEADAGMGSNRSVASQYTTTTSRSGWLPSVSLGFGRLDQSGNSDVDGDAISAALVGTWYFDNTNWLGDIGLGIQKQYFPDNQPTAGLITFSGRYEFPRRFSIGPVVDLMFGTTEQFGSANNYYSMGGVEGFKEITFANDQLLRIGLKFTTQFGITDQTSNLFGLVAQWGVGSSNTFIQRQRSEDVSMNE